MLHWKNTTAFRSGERTGNMKKWILLLAALLTAASFSACNASQADAMHIAASRFSKETQEVLQIVQEEYAFFDYTIDDTVGSCSIDFWLWEDGGWINAGKVEGSAEKGSHRIALRLTDGACDLYLMDGDGFSKMSYPVSSGVNACSSTGGSRLETSAAIELDREIPLWAVFGSNGSSMALAELSDFRTTECDAGMAATITFSREKAE